MDKDDDNPNGWYGISSSRAVYTNGVGAEIYTYITYSYSGSLKYSWDYRDFTQVRAVDLSNIPSDISQYTQFAVTITNGFSAITDFWLAYTTSESDTTGTYLSKYKAWNTYGVNGASSETFTTNSDGTRTGIFTLQNQYTTKPYQLAFGTAGADYSDDSDRWHYSSGPITVTKIELL